MVTEKKESGVLIFPEAIQGIPEQDRLLVDSYMRVLEPVHAFYQIQKGVGFYGGLASGESLPPEGDSPYTIIKLVDGEFRAFGYIGVEPFGRFTRQIANRMEEVIKVAEDTSDLEKNLIEDTLRSQAQAFRKGDFKGATISSLNTRRTPRYQLYVGLLDRYLDPDQGIKLAMQGWLQSRDNTQQSFLDDIASQILKGQGSGRALRLFVGDMLAAAGMAADRPWSGNTTPSEDNIRREVGADAYIFTNNMDFRVDMSLIPAMRKYLPQVTQISGWEELMHKVTKLGTTAHETGHSQIQFDEGTVSLLGGRYMAIKELMSELFGLVNIAKLPRGTISAPLRQLLIARSLVQWRSYKDEYELETDPYKKTIVLPYALAGEWRLNALQKKGGIKIGDDGAILVENWDVVADRDEELYQEMKTVISNERLRQDLRFVDTFIELYSSDGYSQFFKKKIRPSVNSPRLRLVQPAIS